MKYNTPVGYFIALAFAISYALFWANIDILAAVKFENILDRENYIYYVKYSLDELSQNVYGSIFILIFNEPIFLLIMAVLNILFVDDVIVLRVLIGLISFVSAYICFEKTKSLFYSLVVLIVPQIFGNYVMSLRQGVAVAFFIVAWFYRPGWLRNSFFLILPLIHSSFYITLFLIIISRILLKIIRRKFLYALIVAGLILFFISSALHLADYLGVRQAAGYIDGGDVEAGLGGAIFWGAILVIYLLNFQPKEVLDHDVVQYSYYFILAAILFYLVAYFSLPALSRSIQNHALLIFILGWNMLSRFGRMILGLVLLLYAIFTSFGFYSRGVLAGFLS